MDNPQADPQLRVVEVVPDDMKRAVYSNAFRALYTPYDVELVFAHVSLIGGGREDEFEARVSARVILQPVLAKRMLDQLTETVKAYEGEFGEIKEVENDLHNRVKAQRE